MGRSNKKRVEYLSLIHIFYLVSEQLNVSNSYLSTTFKATYGVSIIQYINRLRVDQAKSLILNTDMNIKDIAQTVGFSSDINFIRVFKKLENRCLLYTSAPFWP